MAAISMPASPRATVELAANHAANAGDARDMASGEVRRIEKGQNTITLKHGAISSISMPPMTMTFKVRDPALLEKVRVGDKVLFRAEVARDGTTYVVALEPVR
jgi:Cu/Ag efflux protein CusF